MGYAERQNPNSWRNLEPEKREGIKASNMKQKIVDRLNRMPRRARAAFLRRAATLGIITGLREKESRG